MQQYRDSDAMALSLGLGRGHGVGSSSSFAGQLASASDSESDSELSSTGCQARLVGLRVRACVCVALERWSCLSSARCRVYRPPLWTGVAATSLYTCPTIKMEDRYLRF